jgi:hypothetical protein
MMALAGPLYLLFELSVVLSVVVFRNRRRREEAKAARAAEAAEAARAEAARLAAAPPPDEAGPRRLGEVPTPFDQQGVA